MDTHGRQKTENGLNIGVYGDRMDGYGRLWTRMDEVKMGCVGIEPTTCGLKVRCSTN
jgi:hypothetical protein